MKYILIIITFACISILSCGEDTEPQVCPDCFSYTQPLRISFLNSVGENLLDYNNSDHITVGSVISSTNQNLIFELKNRIDGNDVDFWFLESINRPAKPDCVLSLDCRLCVNEDCELYISYTGTSNVDTLNVLYEKQVVYDENGCPCTGYPLRYIKINGEEITEFNWEPNNTGAAIIRK